MKKCNRLEFQKCPYRYEKIDYEHWIIKCGKSLAFAEERATIMCQSTPCNYAIEKLLSEQPCEPIKLVEDDKMTRGELIENVIDLTIKGMRDLLKETPIQIEELDVICRFAKSSALANAAMDDRLYGKEKI